MLKLVGGLAIAVLATIFSLGTVQQGLKDLKVAWTHWAYHDIRDMRRSVALMPQKVSNRAPDSLTVPTTGWGDRLNEDALMADREAATKGLVNPVASDDSSIARGSRIYIRMCVPCHGKEMAGDGPVAASFMPPPDLLAEATRNRTDGYIFSYIRHGGVVMPRYGQSVTAHEAWDVINFLRQRQKANPR
jgi:mono/diheme cytochrome c family protein